MDGLEGLGCFLSVLALAAVLSGPIALIMAWTALKRTEEMRRRWNEVVMRATAQSPEPPAAPTVSATVPETTTPEPAVQEALASAAAEPVEGGPFKAESLAENLPPGIEEHPPATPRPPFWSEIEAAETHAGTASLEQRIGTRWVLVAGVITVVFAVGFFLKYAYENEWIGPWGRVLIAGLGGLVSLAIGEVTRRRGYDFVAKGVTALGFAILYATVFAAYRWYGLIGPGPAYVLAVGVTIGAMFYAVVLDEVAIALLSLAGGYLTPIMLSTGENLPNPLFGYVLILSTGAMLCAYWRKWSPVNILAFLGTYLLYTAWFEKFYRPVMDIRWPPPQFGVALFWLAVFFVVFLTLPVLHTLLRRVRSQTQDVLLALANAAVVFYYLWTMLMDAHRDWLAVCSVMMGLAYLGLMGLVSLRCRADGDLRNAMLIAGLAFISLAVPLYFETRTIAIVWAIEAVALTAVGLRYRHTLVQVAAGAVLALAIGKLAVELPLHTASFRPVLNVEFGAWCFVAAAVMVCHALYRFDSRLDADIREVVAQLLYAAGLLVLMTGIGLELWYIPTNEGEPFFEEQMILVFSAVALLFAARPPAPEGPVRVTGAVVLGAVGSVFLAVAYAQMHEATFRVFANADFARALALVAALFTAAWLLVRGGQRRREELAGSMALAIVGVLLLWLVLTQEIWLHYRLQGRVGWRLLAHMYISVAWAGYASVLMVVGFWRRVGALRYIALGIFLLLLGKIFLVDTRTVETIYRIAGFLVTGLALVGVSYLYQYLKKKGFFEAIR